MSVHIVLKGVPPSLNTVAGRKNVWEYREQKKFWTHYTWAMCRNCKERPEKPFEKALVQITYYFPDRRRRDPDNYSGKFMLDGLTKGGIIKDDSFSCVKLLLIGECDPVDQRVEIAIVPTE